MPPTFTLFIKSSWRMNVCFSPSCMSQALLTAILKISPSLSLTSLPEVLISGPCVSIIMLTGNTVFLFSSLMRFIIISCQALSPWDMFILTMFMPFLERLKSISSDSVLGPMVATIFVRLIAFWIETGFLRFMDNQILHLLQQQWRGQGWGCAVRAAEQRSVRSHFCCCQPQKMQNPILKKNIKIKKTKKSALKRLFYCIPVISHYNRAVNVSHGNAHLA